MLYPLCYQKIQNPMTRMKYSVMQLKKRYHCVHDIAGRCFFTSTSQSLNLDTELLASTHWTQPAKPTDFKFWLIWSYFCALFLCRDQCSSWVHWIVREAQRSRNRKLWYELWLSKCQGPIKMFLNTATRTITTCPSIFFVGLGSDPCFDIDDKYQTSGIDIEVLPISTISKHPGSTISKLLIA
jgi:hypothetical protein